jgi:trans-aconitate 2-methyltransferase
MDNDLPWNAVSYDKVSSNVQLEWGRKLLDKRSWVENEIIMDAGSGSGNLTRILCEKVPSGRVYAVDADSNMVLQSKSALSHWQNVEVIQSRMENVILPRQVDIIFSNSALHWILDQEDVFSHFRKLLKPNGELLIECGGHGNINKALSIIFQIMQSYRFNDHFSNWSQTWLFPKKDETARLLQKVGFGNVQVNLSNISINFIDRQSFANFIEAVIMKAFLGYIPDANKKDQFLTMFLEEFERAYGNWSLDFVRLNIFAKNI